MKGQMKWTRVLLALYILVRCAQWGEYLLPPSVVRWVAERTLSVFFLKIITKNVPKKKSLSSILTLMYNMPELAAWCPMWKSQILCFLDFTIYLVLLKQSQVYWLSALLFICEITLIRYWFKCLFNANC